MGIFSLDNIFAKHLEFLLRHLIQFDCRSLWRDSDISSHFLSLGNM